MREETLLQRIIVRFFKRIGLIKEYEVDKTEMCRRATASGVCPKFCEACIWNDREDENDEEN